MFATSLAMFVAILTVFSVGVKAAPAKETTQHQGEKAAQKAVPPQHLVTTNVAVFVGEGSKNTEPFKVGPRWKLSWNADWKADKGDPPTGNFSITVHRVKDKSEAGVVANVIGKSEDASAEYEAGEFYLEIMATEPYLVQVTEQYDSYTVPIDTAAINNRDSSGRTPLIKAVDNNDLILVKRITAKGADINGTGEHGDTALMSASRSGHTDIVLFLLSKGASVNLADDRGKTALFNAAFVEYYPDVVKILLDKGADVNILDKTGHTALDWAIREGSTKEDASKVIALLKAAGATSSVTNP